MPLEDLDLVFDDEDDPKKKKNEMVIDQEISFAVQADAPVAAVKNAQVKSMEEFKNQKVINQIQPTQDATARDLSVQSKNVSQPNDASQSVLRQTEIKLAVAEYKLEFFTELQSDSKLMEYQINQLLLRIHQKNPEAKGEILAIKKILADFNAKKRK